MRTERVNRVLSVLLAAVMLLGMTPSASLFAAEPADDKVVSTVSGNQDNLTLPAVSDNQVNTTPSTVSDNQVDKTSLTVSDNQSAAADSQKKKTAKTLSAPRMLRASAADGSVEINVENFPDANFRESVKEAVKNQVGSDKDVLTADDIKGIRSIYCRGNKPEDKISDLTGIEYFTSLEGLYCSRNNIKTMDLSKNTSLTTLECGDNPITELDISENTQLKKLTADFDTKNMTITIPDYTNTLDLYAYTQNASVFPNTSDVSGGHLASGNIYFNLCCDTITFNAFNRVHTLKRENANDVEVNETNFPDSNFRWDIEEQIICNKARTEGDKIRLTPSEIKNTTSLCISAAHQVTDLTGIEYLTSLEELDCSNTEISTIDVSQSSSLRTLRANFANRDLTIIVPETPEIILYDGKEYDPLVPDKIVSGGKFGTDGTILFDTNSNEIKFEFGGHSHTVKRNDPNALQVNKIKDANFRSFIQGLPDAADGVLDPDEIKKITEIDCSGKGISDLTGIEYFTSLETLDCSDNKLTKLDVSENVVLKDLKCNNNQLTELAVMPKPISGEYRNDWVLDSLDCSNNNLTKLDVSQEQALTKLNCSYNKIEELETDFTYMLQTLNCSENQLTEICTSNSTGLTTLDCSNTRIEKLKVSGNTQLENLICNDTKLKSLVLYENPDLKILQCNNTGIAELDVSENKELGKIIADFAAKNMTIIISENIAQNLLYSDENTPVITEDTVLTNGKKTDGRITFDENSDNITFEFGDYEHTLKKANPEEVLINATNFPDESFRNNTVKFLSGAEDGKFTPDEIKKITKIECHKISNLTGIEHFTALILLDCSNNDKMTELDLSENTELEELYCYNDNSDGGLKTLDLSTNTKLKTLKCYGNQLTDLTLPDNSALTDLNCSSNTNLKKLNLSKNTKLTEIDCGDTGISDLNISTNKNLEKLYADFDQRTMQVTLSGSSHKNIDIMEAPFPNNNVIVCGTDWKGGKHTKEYGILFDEGKDTITFKYNNFTHKLVNADKQPSSNVLINETNFPDKNFRKYIKEELGKERVNEGWFIQEEIAKINYIDCSGKGISDLTGIEYFTSLETLDCSDNKLTKLDTSKNSNLTGLECSGNFLETLDVSKNQNLNSLSCFNDSQLTELNASDNESLTGLYCYDNENLRTIDVSKSQGLEELKADFNLYDLTIIIPDKISKIVMTYKSSDTTSGLKNPAITCSSIKGGKMQTRVETTDGSLVIAFGENSDMITFDAEGHSHTLIKAGCATYTVKHMLQNLDDTGSYTLAEENGTEKKAGRVGAVTEAQKRGYTGFTVQTFTQKKICEDGTTVVEIRYNRNKHNLTWNMDGGEASGNYTKGEVLYGASIIKPETVTRKGYTFKNWDSEPDSTMPDKDLIYTALWDKAELEGTVSITGETRVGKTLTAVPDMTNNTGTLSYQWKADDKEISGATEKTYTLQDGDKDKKIKVTVKSDVQTGEISSDETSAIIAEDDPATVPEITVGSLAKGVIGTEYQQELTANGDDITWSISSADKLPDGLRLEGSDIKGTPAKAGTFNFTVKATNKAGSVEKECSIEIEKKPSPAAPSGITGSAPLSANGKGKLNGTTAEMEYDDNTEFSSAQSCTETATEVTAGKTYYVRLAETEDTCAGEYVTVKVSAYKKPVEPTPADPVPADPSPAKPVPAKPVPAAPATAAGETAGKKQVNKESGVPQILKDREEESISDTETKEIQNVETVELTEVPAALENTEFDTVEKVEEALHSRIEMQISGDSEIKTEVKTKMFDAVLMITVDDKTRPATEEEIKKMKEITFVIPFPDDITADTANRYNFSVAHMVTIAMNGLKPGDIETPEVTVTEDGLMVTFHGMSPVMVSYSSKEEEPAESVVPEETEEPEVPATFEADTDTASGSHVGIYVTVGVVLVVLIAVIVVLKVLSSRKKEEE